MYTSAETGATAFESESFVFTIIKLASSGLQMSQLGTQCTVLGQMVLKGVNWVHNSTTRSNGLETSQ